MQIRWTHSLICSILSFVKPLKAIEVFTPGILPTHTYYERPTLNLEQSLLDAVDTPGIIAAVSGPSKSGKTVLCETVVGVNSMLLVTGGGIDSESAFWQRIRSKLKAPIASSTSTGSGASREIGANAKGGLGFLVKGEASLEGKFGRSEQQQSTFQFEGLSGVDLLAQVRAAGKTLVVDDFHYISREVQVSLVEQFKEAARAGCTIVVVSVPHRADDAIRANPDLRGRLRLIEVPYWTEAELLNIPRLGFPKLNVVPDEGLIKRFALESLSSPQLMQSLCLDLCRSERVDEQQTETRNISLDEEKLKKVLQTIATTSSGQTALDILEKGPRVRGTERNNYELIDGSSGDVYTVVIKAMARGTPKLSLSYAQIRERVGQVTKGEPPSGSSIVSTLTKMDEAAQEMRQGDRVLEWDPEKETLNFPDPYFLYFLRWKV
jgi:hypothetical protein